MELRTLGRTDLRVSVLGLGGGPYRGPDISAEEVAAIARAAFDAGVNLFETAEDYDEAKMGWGVREFRSDVILATKCTESLYESMLRAVEKSLEQLRTDYVDIYQLHYVNSHAELQRRIEGGALEALKEAKRQGRVRFIGLSGHYIPTLIRAIELDEFDVVQVPYHLGHGAAEELFPVARSRGVGVIGMKTLGGGFLVDPRLAGERPREGAERMTAAAALRFVLSNPDVASALVGMRGTSQVRENVDAIRPPFEMDEEEKRSLGAASAAFLGIDYCRTCKYCAPCAVYGWDLDIDGILRIAGTYQRYGYRVATLEAYRNLRLKGDACVGCGTCLPKCPYGIDIPGRLREAHTLFSAAAFHIAAGLSRGQSGRDVLAALDKVEEAAAASAEAARARIERFRLAREIEGAGNGGDGESGPITELERDDALREALGKRVRSLFGEAAAEWQKGELYRALSGFRNAAGVCRMHATFADLRALETIARRMVAECLSAMGQEGEAEEIGPAALCPLPSTVEGLRELADIIMDYRLYPQALEYLQGALSRASRMGEQEPGVMEALWDSLIRYFRESGDAGSAARLAASDPTVGRMLERPKVLRELGEFFMDSGAHREAFPILRRGIETADGSEEIEPLWYALVRCHRETEDYDGAIEFILTLLPDHPDNPVLQFTLGECYMEKEDYPGAIASLRRALDLRPKMNWAYFSLGKCLYKVGEDDAALEEMDRDIEICEDPLSHFHAWYFKAMIHHRAGRPDQARDALEEAKGFEEYFGMAEIPEEKDFLAELEKARGPE